MYTVYCCIYLHVVIYIEFLHSGTDVHPMWYNCQKSRHCMWHLEVVYSTRAAAPNHTQKNYRHLTFWFWQNSKQMLQINVTLPNGHHELLTVPQSSTVGDLKIAAQQAFGDNFLRLITAEPRALVDLEESLVGARLEDGDYLSAVILQPQLAATAGAFALWCCGGNTVITWGDEHSGGDSSGVQDQLKHVQQIRATGGAFAAILADGSIVTWGNVDLGGDSTAVQDELKDVQQIQATAGAFAAAKGRAADSGHRLCIHSDTGGWVSCHLGRWRLWWWQLSDTR